MMNMVRADLYALLRGKAFYVTFGIVLLVNMFMIGGLAIGMGIGMPPLDGMGSARFLYGSDTTVFLLLPLFFMAAAPIFIYATVKNDLAWGIPRARLYLSKLATTMLLCAFSLLFYMASGMLVATAINGFGSPVDGYWQNFFQVLGSQLFIMLALTCIGIFLVFTTKRTGAVIGIYFAFILVPTIVFAIMSAMGLGTAAEMLRELDLRDSISRLANIGQMETGEAAKILGAGAAYMLVSTAGGIALFKRAEIK